MNKFLEKIMELGAAEDRCCSETERKIILKEVEEVYKNHITELKLFYQPDVSDSVSIIDEGNINYHIERGCIEHFYFIDENKEFATCQCGRVLRKHYH